MGWKTNFSDPVSMKTPLFILLLSIWLALPGPSSGDMTDRDLARSLRIVDKALCLHVSDLKCSGTSSRFPSHVGKLYCLTKIVGATDPTSVTHVWYFGNKERSRVRLTVKSANWRTYSAKTIRPRETGAWRVEVLGPQGKRLAVCEFQIAPAGRADGTAPVPTQTATDTPIVPTGEVPLPATAKAAPTEASRAQIPWTHLSPGQSGAADTTSYRAATVIGNRIELRTGEKRTDTLYVDLDHYATPVVLVLGGEIPRVAVHIMSVSGWDGPVEIPVNGTAVRQVRSRLDPTSNMLRILLNLDPTADYDVKSYPRTKSIYCIEISKRRSNQ